MRRLILFVLAALLLGSCARLPGRWDVLDLRLLDPPDDAPTPDLDIIALYTRTAGARQEFRVDLLDLGDRPPGRIYLAFDTGPGGATQIPGTGIVTDLEWDLLVSVPNPGTTQILLPDGSLPPPGLNVGAGYNYPQDYLSVSLPLALFPNEFQLQVFSMSPSGLADKTRPVSSIAKPPARAPLLLSFTDAFPAASPAQALRRWDGAHTGPYGERHGLKPLLDAAGDNHIPLALLDLRTPDSLSALNLVGGLEKVRRMQEEGLVTIANASYGRDGQTSAVFSEEAARLFRLAPSEFAYSLTGDPQPGYRFQFASLPDSSHLAHDSSLDLTLFPISNTGEQIAPDGLSLDTRRKLLETAISSDPADLVSLGGSLPSSAWGDSDASEASMEYIAQHPWIKPLNPLAAETFPATEIGYAPPEPDSATYPRYTSAGADAGMDSQALAAKLQSDLRAAPAGPITDSAWDMFFALTAPSNDPKQGPLQAQYLGKVGIMIAANRWARSPSPQATCDLDLDYDGVPECILANDRLFAVFEREGGRLAYLFSVDKTGPHQLVGGTEQFMVGLSDRSAWKIDQGAAADPQQIPGAFVDEDAPWSLYAVSSLGPDSLTLTRTDGKRVKSFRLMTDAVSTQYTLAEPLRAKFALTLDPWLRFHQGWGSGYYARLGDGLTGWSVRGGPSLSIQAEGRTNFTAFNDSMDLLRGPEDPNQDFPPGHYLPLPMAVAEYEVDDGASFVMRVK